MTASFFPKKLTPRLLRHAAYWLFWLLLYATVNAEKNEKGFLLWAGLEALILTIKIPFTCLMMYWLVPQFLIRRRYIEFLFWVILATFTGGVLLWGVYTRLFTDLFNFGKMYSIWSAIFFYKTLDLLYVATFPVIYKLNQFYLEQEARHREIVEQKLSAELELLKNQLHPHFLFNTLNNLYSLVLNRQPEAAEVVVRLSDLMSYMLYESNGTAIPLKKEVGQLRNYIELEKIRYADRLEISFESTGTDTQVQIAPLLLIGFIENAFKHGVGSNPENAWIRINLVIKDNRSLDFMIENSQPLHQGHLKVTSITHGGIGLSNIRKRLELIYPGRHQLHIESGETFLVNLHLDL